MCSDVSYILLWVNSISSTSPRSVFSKCDAQYRTSHHIHYTQRRRNRHTVLLIFSFVSRTTYELDIGSVGVCEKRRKIKSVQRNSEIYRVSNNYLYATKNLSLIYICDEFLAPAYKLLVCASAMRALQSLTHTVLFQIKILTYLSIIWLNYQICITQFLQNVIF